MGCGCAASIGIRIVVMDESKKQIIDEHKGKRNQVTPVLSLSKEKTKRAP